MTDADALARRIGTEHAFEKHVLSRGEFPSISDRAQFARVIEDVIANHDEFRSLRFGRSLDWQAAGEMIVIVDPTHPDGGTAFRRVVGMGELSRFS